MNSKYSADNPGTELSILEQIRKRGLLNAAGIRVRVRGGVADIEGSVPSLTQKNLTEAIATGTEGVRTVVNRLVIAPMAVVDDEHLAALVRDALQRNSSIDAAGVSFEVSGGCVHFKGSVGARSERCAAEDEAWSVQGVRGIINDIQVVPAKPRGGVQVVDEVSRGLAECLYMDVTEVGVAFRRGVVTLSGPVSNIKLKTAAEELARWTPSVVDVVNELEVAPLGEPGGAQSVPTWASPGAEPGQPPVPMTQSTKKLNGAGSTNGDLIAR